MAKSFLKYVDDFYIRNKQTKSQEKQKQSSKLPKIFKNQFMNN